MMVMISLGGYNIHATMLLVTMLAFRFKLESYVPDAMLF